MKIVTIAAACILLSVPQLFAKESSQVEVSAPHVRSLDEIKAIGAAQSDYRKRIPNAPVAGTPQPRLEEFKEQIAPILRRSCFECHGTDVQEGDFRVDTLDANLVEGDDVDWWLDVMDVIGNGEMPPEGEAALGGIERSKVVNWLATEIQMASRVRRSEQGHTSFRRMSRYEYNYAMQDLLGLPYDFAEDLPPETPSEDGFTNSSEVLHMSSMQFQTYRVLARQALQKAIVRGERPAPLYWGITMEDASASLWKLNEKALAKLKKKYQDQPDVLARELANESRKDAYNPRASHFKNLVSGECVNMRWRYSGAKYAMPPTRIKPQSFSTDKCVAIIPARQRQVVELGDQLPETGVLRVRVRACRTSVIKDRPPSLQLRFGHQASNNSSAEEVVSHRNIPVLATLDSPRFYQWDVPLSEITRNPLRGIAKMGATPNPSEYLELYNPSSSPSDIQIDYVEVIAPAVDQWPPESHRRIFVNRLQDENEEVGAREILLSFMPRAWRREVSESEVAHKLRFFNLVRPKCADFEEAIIEVLSTVLASPNFLYVGKIDTSESNAGSLPDFQLATRLSMFLWCSTPDAELLALARAGTLSDPSVLAEQTQRLLQDERSKRFSKEFVRGWLRMERLDFLKVDAKSYPRFDNELRESMQKEPVEFFHNVLQQNLGVMDFLHADYAVVNERLAKHYGLHNVYGSHFRPVLLEQSDIPGGQRGGLLTQAGLLAMNSDGTDSHPLKRGIWMLESLLNDPPPPPPPAVPEIDLADPAVAKMTLKERIEDHRNSPACMSCHAKIDPWGIAFENYDAVGSYRTTIGDKPVDANSLLFNRQELAGIDGLKRFLLRHRQDQFARALVHKMATFALGRPLTFADRSEVDRITSDLRANGDGLGDLVRLIVDSELFQ